MNLPACFDPSPPMPAWLAELDREVIRAPGRTALTFGLVSLNVGVTRGVRSWMFEEDANYRALAKRIVAAAVAEGKPVTVRELLDRAMRECKGAYNPAILTQYIDSELE